VPTPTPCLRCGYDLQGLSAGGNCPECGMGVDRSLAAGDELRHAPPAWLAGLTWGAWLLSVCLLALAVVPFVYPSVPGPGRVVADSFMLAMSLAFVAGTWLLTRPQPRFDETTPARRWVTRAAAAALALEVVTADLFNLAGSPAFLHLTPVWTLAFAAFPPLLFLHLRRLALRLPDPRLALHCAVVSWGGSAGLVLLLGMSFAPDWLFRGPAGRSLRWAEAFSAAVWLLFLLGSTLTLLRFALAFGKAWRASRDAWDAADASAVVPRNPIRAGHAGL